jgi:hypothetical protein
MKIGDIVRQGDRICKITRSGKPRQNPTNIGIVVDIHDMPSPRPEEAEALRQMMHMLGRQIDVLWENGKLTKNFAENSLDVITNLTGECKLDE